MKTEMRRFIFEQLRLGTSPEDICSMLDDLLSEMALAKQYLYAALEAKHRP